MSRTLKLLLCAAVFAAAVPAAIAVAGSTDGAAKPHPHVLLISVDGLHQSDLATWVHDNPNSTLAKLTGAGTTYTSASTTRPSDSFPGLLSEVTGGTPKSTGVFYDDAYDRTYYQPAAQTPTGTQNCSGPAGTEAMYAENVDVNAPSTANNQVGTRTILGETIDPKQLPYQLVNGQCVPVMPSDYLRTNTVFSVAHENGLRSAWSDKHPAYQLVNGHGTPKGVDDFFAAEINADIIPAQLTDTRGNIIKFPFPNPTHDANGPILTDYVGDTEAYDQIKVDAILNEIDGLTSTGKPSPGTPSIFGMNFQTVSVGQKTIDPTLSCQRSNNGPHCDPHYVPGGYEPGTLAFTPQMSGQTVYPASLHVPPVPGALNYVDGALGQMVAELKAKGLLDSTRIIITAKHGQSPIDPAQLAKIGHAATTVLKDAGIDIAQLTDDDVALVWLKHQSQTGAAVTALTTAPGQGQARVETVLSGNALAATFQDPLSDSRTPDLIVEPMAGTIYTSSGSKVAEHGGFSPADTHVALLVADGKRWGLPPAPTYNNEPVTTTQIGPTILQTLNLNPIRLDAVKVEKTQVLPGLF